MDPFDEDFPSEQPFTDPDIPSEQPIAVPGIPNEQQNNEYREREDQDGLIENIYKCAPLSD